MLDITLPRIKNTKTQGNYASYDIEPLEAGYGQTLGNALRRVLLSSLPGAAVTSIRIEGVQHEFQDVTGVLEDVTDIVLNIKKLRLRSFSEHPVTMRVEVSGEREVTAADIVAPSTVEIVNPELHIATLDNDNAHLDMELVVESGRSYVPADSKEDQPIGVIPVDAIYTPVQKVNYTVEHTRVGQMTNYDKIVLEIITDGTITPDEALRQSADILVRHLSLLANYRASLPEPENAPLSSLPIPQKIYDTPIEELDLSVRAYNCLKRSNITKVGQVLSMNEEDLLGVRNFGEKSLQELRERLLARNFLPNPRTSAVGADVDGDHEMEE
ncbi:DNA-directed RNA polymerase subunit alpha [Ktedonospora formicarum]|uniref:DNA-directed RNA polymerase subunit alpha n=1 Tax=Ktedonospora formicarum TaxID=2778364 RepID=A0A8J3HZM2_9CHLR|nr:DNA-directed RNA polymerase subunit alpha [Ktedonospora formicarum]GHO44040.1 DNA-directed RNA polymerase subunit alpha [Ktedonospora formicarum]